MAATQARRVDGGGEGARESRAADAIRAAATALGWRLSAIADDGSAPARVLADALRPPLAEGPEREARLFVGTPTAAASFIRAGRGPLAEGARTILAGGIAPEAARAALLAEGLDLARTRVFVAEDVPDETGAPAGTRLVSCDPHAACPLDLRVVHPRAPLARDFAAILAARRLVMRGATESPDHGRAAAARWAAAHAPAPRADVRIERPGPFLRRYLPPEIRGGTFAYLHGGGLVYYDLDVFEGLLSELAARTGRPVLAIGYESCPEHEAGAVIDGLLARVSAALPDEPDLAIAGDSIGGLLALYAARCLPGRFARAVLLYPVLALAQAHPSAELYGERLLLDATRMRWFRALVAPALAARGFDPTLLARDALGGTTLAVVSAGCDVLADEAASFAAHAPFPVRHVPLPDLPHDFLLHAGTLASARAGLEAVVACLTPETNR